MYKPAFIFISLMQCCLYSYGQSAKPVACNQIDWTEWNSPDERGIKGNINAQNKPVVVTMTASLDFEWSPKITHAESFNRFKSPVPKNAVPRTTWSKEGSGTITICFSEAVKEPVLLLASLGDVKGTVQNTITFSEPFVMFYNGGGAKAGDYYSLSGREGYVVVKFPGDVNCITLKSSTSETFTDLTVGIPVCPEGIPKPLSVLAAAAEPKPVINVPAAETQKALPIVKAAIPEPKPVPPPVVPTPKPIVAAPVPEPIVEAAKPAEKIIVQQAKPAEPEKVSAPPVAKPIIPEPAKPDIPKPVPVAPPPVGKIAPPALPISKPVVAEPKPFPVAQAPVQKAIPLPKPPTSTVTQKPAASDVPARAIPARPTALSDNRMRIKVWDYSGMDYDSVSIKVNGKQLGPTAILLRLDNPSGLTDATYPIDLQPGENTLEIYAIGEGLKPFATVGLLIMYEGKPRKLFFALKAKESTVVKL